MKIKWWPAYNMSVARLFLEDLQEDGVGFSFSILEDEDGESYFEIRMNKHAGYSEQQEVIDLLEECGGIWEYE